MKMNYIYEEKTLTSLISVLAIVKLHDQHPTAKVEVYQGNVKSFYIFSLFILFYKNKWR